jgi:anti-sigma factor RsiW
MTITDIVTNIDRRLADLHAEVAHLEGARLALLNGSQPAPAPKARRARRKPAEPKHQVVPAGKLTALLTGTNGLRTAELAKATNGDPAQVLALLKEQESAREVRRTGTRAATRWHVITDEDRIAARAAELNAQSRRSRARQT